MKKLIIGLTVGMLIGSSTVALAAPSTVQATLKKFRIVVNGETQISTSNQLVYKGSTYVPIRETANMLHFSTNYNAKANTIEFKSNPLSTEWITLIELQALNKISITTITGKEDAYEITSAGNSLLKINGEEIKEGDSTVVSNINNNQIHVKKSLGVLLLNKQDLKNAGFNVN
ncbi:hypothetical protein [Paenibacillus favisporus]|uniref:hypothetical protein n=1 Tax=Paenibacillus favisporus TaxID=221028 RepID=UPI0013D49FB3|nr:hypothetical protein [Paenibacillus favisporus]